MRNVLLVIFTAIVLEFAFTSSAGANGHALTFGDLLANWEILSAIASPVGDQYAVVLRRPWSERAVYGWHDWFDNIARTDVWIVDVHTTKFENISHGETDGSANFAPIWSTNGKSLAFVSTRLAENGRIYVWDRASGKVSIGAERDLAIGVNFGSIGPYSGSVPFAWLDGERLVTAFAPRSGWAMSLSYKSIYEQGLKQWRITAGGSTPSVSVVGGPEAGPNRIKEKVDLAIVDVSSRAVQVIAEGAFGGIAISPTKKRLIAFADADAPQLKDVANIRFPTFRNLQVRLEYECTTTVESYMLAADRSARLEWRKTLPDHLKALAYSATSFPAWSKGERYLAITAAYAASPDPEEPMGELLVLARDTGQVIYRDNARLGRAYWQGARLVYVRPRGWTSVVPESGAISEILGPVPLVEKNGAFPETWPLDNTRMFAGRIFQIADGQIWELPHNAEGFTRLVTHSTSRYLRFVRSGTPAIAESERLILEAEDGYYSLKENRTETMLQEMVGPSRGDSMLSNSAQNNIFVTNSDSGLRLSIATQNNGTKSSLATFNRHWRDIQDPDRKIIEYEDVTGRRLRGEIYFPLDYKVGQDRPTIVVVYPGWAPSLATRGSLSASKKLAWFSNLARFTSDGFIVFRPEIPKDRGARDLGDNIVEAVLAGMKKFTDDGYGKAGRFGIYGHSYGSIAALTLLSKTKLFEAGVSAASYSNLFAYHDVFSRDTRYSDDADTYQTQNMAEIEDPSAILQLGGPPSAFRDAYVTASPYFSADGITAPLMLVHGELDSTPIENAEMVYNTLRRQGRIVELVRYWGEGHVYQSPANVRDMWMREIEWFKRFLGSPNPVNTTSPR
jgi:dipeptidyl aminopeptidase/acylaminoacyl peptidase